MHWKRKWQSTPVFLPGESQGRGCLVGFCLWGHTESEMTFTDCSSGKKTGLKSRNLYFHLVSIGIYITLAFPSPVLLPGKSHGWRSLVGSSPWDCEESDTTERLHFPFSLSCIGEGNGNPLQCSCLENPRDRGAWWAAIYRVTQSRTRLKRLSSSSK